MEQPILRILTAMPVVLLAMIAITSSHAALVVNDNFDYGASDLSNGYGGWEDGTSQAGYEAGVTASWAGDSDYTLGGAGGSLRSYMFSSSATYRGAQLDIGVALTGTFWTSILIREEIAADDNSGGVVAYKNGTYSGTSGWGNTDAFALNGNGNLATTPGSGASLTEVSGPVALPAGWGLYVVKVNVGVGADSIDLWAFDASDSFGATEASLGAATYSSSSVQYGDDIQDFWLGVGAGAPGATSDVNFDNLRVSDLSGDDGLSEVLSGVAVPEPSTYAMLAGFLAFSCVMVRRRQR